MESTTPKTKWANYIQIYTRYARSSFFVGALLGEDFMSYISRAPLKQTFRVPGVGPPIAYTVGVRLYSRDHIRDFFTTFVVLLSLFGFEKEYRAYFYVYFVSLWAGSWPRGPRWPQTVAKL